MTNISPRIASQCGTEQKDSKANRNKTKKLETLHWRECVNKNKICLGNFSVRVKVNKKAPCVTLFHCNLQVQSKSRHAHKVKLTIRKYKVAFSLTGQLASIIFEMLCCGQLALAVPILAICVN